jgi:two-component system, cell cycle response regulator DivK
MARILFIDDDPMTLETLTNAVQIFGHQAMQASTGQDGLELATGQAPDLIFLDLSLADIDSLALVGMLRSQPATAAIPVLVLSAGPELDVAERVKAAGAQAYLSKPIHLQTLIEVVNQYTARPPA